MTCPRNQAEYIKVTEIYPSPFKPGGNAVKELTYHVSEDFADRVYDSLKDVLFPSSNSKMIVYLCGTDQCSPKLLFNFVGKKDPSPMQINFMFTNETTVTHDGQTFIPMNTKTVHCSEAPIGYSNQTCSCEDCPSKCTVTPHLV
jgi:Niemann-Pick C1 protein